MHLHSRTKGLCPPVVQFTKMAWIHMFLSYIHDTYVNDSYGRCIIVNKVNDQYTNKNKFFITFIQAVTSQEKNNSIKSKGRQEQMFFLWHHSDSMNFQYVERLCFPPSSKPVMQFGTQRGQVQLVPKNSPVVLFMHGCNGFRLSRWNG